MRPGREAGALEPGVEKTGGTRDLWVPSFPWATPSRKHPISKASSRPCVRPTQPGSWGANPDVRPEFPAAGRHCPRRLPFTLATANPRSRLAAGSAPMQLLFHWLPPKLGTFISYPAIRPERCPSPCTRPHRPAIGLAIKARKGFWLTGKAIQSKPKSVTQSSSGVGLN